MSKSNNFRVTPNLVHDHGWRVVAEGIAVDGVFSVGLLKRLHGIIVGLVHTLEEEDDVRGAVSLFRSVVSVNGTLKIAS